MWNGKNRAQEQLRVVAAWAKVKVDVFGSYWRSMAVVYWATYIVVLRSAGVHCGAGVRNGLRRRHTKALAPDSLRTCILGRLVHVSSAWRMAGGL